MKTKVYDITTQIISVPFIIIYLGLLLFIGGLLLAHLTILTVFEWLFRPRG